MHAGVDYMRHHQTQLMQGVWNPGCSTQIKKMIKKMMKKMIKKTTLKL